MRRYQRTIRLLATASLALTLNGCGVFEGNSCVFHCGRSEQASTPLVQFPPLWPRADLLFNFRVLSPQLIDLLVQGLSASSGWNAGGTIVRS